MVFFFLSSYIKCITIKEEEKETEILFIGTNRGLEKDLIPRAGYELKTIEAYRVE